jgi:hypothetical protein
VTAAICQLARKVEENGTPVDYTRRRRLRRFSQARLDIAGEGAVAELAEGVQPGRQGFGQGGLQGRAGLVPLDEDVCWAGGVAAAGGVAGEAATKALEVAVREQSGLPTGGNLMGRAFADDGPIAVYHHEGATGKDEQSGFRFLYIGVVDVPAGDALRA